MWQGNLSHFVVCELYVAPAAYIPGESLEANLETVTTKTNGKLLPVIEPQSFSP
jgi:hypothetical protein